ncbi:MAG: DUF4493 domain-containing protein [Bacteroidales bacterium]|nr:DUF4493 domain-containing protein [Bacteroidales bacterium]
MKKTITILIAAAVALSLSSCRKIEDKPVSGNGILSFAGLDVKVDETLVTKASAASGNSMIYVKNTSGTTVFESTYAGVKENGGKISLPAGNYVLEARSSDMEVPAAIFEQPIYGTQKDFSITAGETTTLGSLVCTLLQVKATVSYDDAFLETVTGPGKATVKVDPSAPLDFPLEYSGGTPSYTKQAGYFAVAKGGNATMNIVFSGSISGKSQKMVANLTNVEARQWRQIRFVKKTDEEGNATFAVEINSFIDDEEISVPLTVEQEAPIGTDPDAPVGDGGITMTFAEGCPYTDLGNIVVPAGETGMDLRVLISVPNGVKKFVVQMASTSESFISAVALAGGTTLDLINPKEEQDIVFQIVPFPHGSSLAGQTNLLFDLSSAQGPINAFPGKHTFTMEMTDMKGCRASIPVTLVVESH